MHPEEMTPAAVTCVARTEKLQNELAEHIEEKGLGKSGELEN